MSRPPVSKRASAVAVAVALLMTLPSPSAAAVRLRVEASLPQAGMSAPLLTVSEASTATLVAQYNSGGPCGLPSGALCRIGNPAARWVEGNWNAEGRAQTISLEVDGPLAPYNYFIAHPAPAGTPPPLGATVSGTATIYRTDGKTEEIPFSVDPSEVFQATPDPPLPRQGTRRPPKLAVVREFLSGGRKLVVRRDRVVAYKDVALACGTLRRDFDTIVQDDRPCVAYGYLSALRVVGRKELRSPILGRFRLSANAGETVPISVKLSRFGLRYVKRHDPMETYLVVRYAIKGEEKGACERGIPTTACKEKRSSFRAQLRFRP